MPLAKSVTDQGAHNCLIRLLGKCRSTKLRNERLSQVGRNFYEWWESIDHRDRPIVAKLIARNIGQIEENLVILKQLVELVAKAGR
jgi:hypothetical protein